ncbi:MAG: hypothetical protein ACJ8GK_03980 [Luteimonas sp.]
MRHFDPILGRGFEVMQRIVRAPQHARHGFTGAMAPDAGGKRQVQPAPEYGRIASHHIAQPRHADGPVRNPAIWRPGNDSDNRMMAGTNTVP